MTAIPRDTSRDRRIEVPTNWYVIHAAAHALLPLALKWRISANAVSVAGLVVGALAALAFYNWRMPYMASVGLLLATGWLICDGLDGMIARATKSASALGRMLDGLCDHGVFLLIYVSLAWSIGTVEAWLLAVGAGVVHGVQSSLYEGERARFHRRAKGDPGLRPHDRVGTRLERGYDRIMGLLDRAAEPFDRALARASDPQAMGRIYAERAVAPMRAMIPLSGNTRIIAIWLACVFNRPALFWWFEIVVLTGLAIVAMAWHRRVESRFVARAAAATVSS
jgi:hypothetical protein